MQLGRFGTEPVEASELNEEDGAGFDGIDLGDSDGKRLVEEGLGLGGEG